MRLSSAECICRSEVGDMAKTKEAVAITQEVGDEWWYWGGGKDRVKIYQGDRIYCLNFLGNLKPVGGVTAPIFWDTRFCFIFLLSPFPSTSRLPYSLVFSPMFLLLLLIPDLPMTPKLWFDSLVFFQISGPWRPCGNNAIWQRRGLM